MSLPLPSAASAQVYKRGFGLKNEVALELNARYNESPLIAYLRAHQNVFSLGDTKIYLAEEFGFCYGVDKAIDFAFEARRYFPDRRIFMTDEIIHNPRVNNELMEIGIQFLSGMYNKGMSIDDLTPEDVVIIPAFGATTFLEKDLREKGCTLVDTTCGSVVHVWKRVEKYALEGYTAIIHGKYNHEETRATSSRVRITPNAKYLIVRDKAQVETICRYIVSGGNREEFLAEFKDAASPSFDPDSDLEKVGVANQTTMLASESLEIAGLIRDAVVKRYGTEALKDRFCSFDTICRATQDRQDALRSLTTKDGINLFLVVGGYNSSNTSHLLELAKKKCAAFHVQDARDLVSSKEIQHKPLSSHSPAVETDWMPEGAVVLGLTSGTSTPNRVLEETALRFLELRGYVSVDVLSRLTA